MLEFPAPRLYINFAYDVFDAFLNQSPSVSQPVIKSGKFVLSV